ncbi:unnamed protein product [Gongylonema pulchrum]|uniref:Cation efflux system protein CusC n=1 Tax=Gongylonema pulchrum TaxID=637853 RepID=A0A183DIN3_9BILA|nr:unnamed protein product [Gongylonema pulchrum]
MRALAIQQVHANLRTLQRYEQLMSGRSVEERTIFGPYGGINVNLEPYPRYASHDVQVIPHSSSLLGNNEALKGLTEQTVEVRYAE